ncbi:MAG TPA: alpha/beta fold hydrolase [Gordonia sp. (in: high G+C Gram-positive bacteria)]|uniref:alpha/beta fold hydrolase n=1 Tax=unclassified Gordonia (in: high G+C Gram-positive bacteria) TaxID=2657482 RepID=UPI000FA7B98E|nr:MULTISPECIES: alpha/beta fold hydrolase [unclassified Gordonia (in: high G+C Gram-positive bacteria)]RUP36768.1 MAG: alpha/beta fold hydrolase [Gordonia sp. (in: high G+C Gram-positive bacteria)]HNP56960.1 alpha/beta fold hydrolase [Gordonia sp. (in: high G+C Gram-positive bacteria)]HRC50404.1 alpha/beta fold hydrolase [Gordonia sp. (in: high G+C Gram-positive bacteria)]
MSALKRIAAATGAVVAGALIATHGTGAASAAPSYSYLSGLAAQLTAPGPPPGANDWRCRPDAAHPNPVVLLHGLSNDTITWNTLSPVLADAGYCVFTTTYGRGLLGPIGAVATVQESARQIAAFIERVRAATGVSKVDLVGHSMGGAIPFYYLNHMGGIGKIDDYIALGAPLHGSDLSGVQTALAGVLGIPGVGPEVSRQCGGPCQLNPGSPFLKVLNPDPAIAPDIDFTMIVTRYDEIATPYTTGLLRGRNVRNVVLQDRCATDYTEHSEMTADPIAVREILNALHPATAVPARCTTVLPFIGPIG